MKHNVVLTAKIGETWKNDRYSIVVKFVIATRDEAVEIKSLYRFLTASCSV